MREVLKKSWHILGVLVVAGAAVIWLKQAQLAHPAAPGAPASFHAPGGEGTANPASRPREHPAPQPETPGQLWPEEPVKAPSVPSTHYVAAPWQEQIKS